MKTYYYLTLFYICVYPFIAFALFIHFHRKTRNVEWGDIVGIFVASIIPIGNVIGLFVFYGFQSGLFDRPILKKYEDSSINEIVNKNLWE